MESEFRYKVSGGGGEATITSYCGEGGEATITSYCGEGGDVTIPSKLGGAPVRAIGSCAFVDKGPSVTRIELPGTVRRILPHAFELCVQMTELVLHEGVEELGEDFLAATDVRELWIPASVRRIRGAAQLPAKLIVAENNPYYASDGFGLYYWPEGDRLSAAPGSAGPPASPADARQSAAPDRGSSAPGTSPCLLVSLSPAAPCETYTVLPGTTELAMGTFDGRAALRELRLPASVRKIGDGVLSNIRNPYSAEPGIRRVFIDPDNPVYYHDRRGVFERLPGGGLRVIRWLSPAEEMNLGEEIYEIGAAAFSRCHVHRLTASSAVRFIAPDAFEGCPLREFSVRGTDLRALFPENNLYLLKDLLRGFGRNGRLYDFAAYDAKLCDWFPDLSRIEMILIRLVSPHELGGETRARYRRMMTEHMGEVVRIIGRERSMYALRLLTESGLLDENGTDAAIAHLNAAGRPEMTAYLMAFRRSHFRKKEFDFSL